jgi:hypothetical protein
MIEHCWQVAGVCSPCDTAALAFILHTPWRLQQTWSTHLVRSHVESCSKLVGPGPTRLGVYTAAGVVRVAVVCLDTARPRGRWQREGSVYISRCCAWDAPQRLPQNNNSQQCYSLSSIGFLPT